MAGLCKKLLYSAQCLWFVCFRNVLCLSAASGQGAALCVTWIELERVWNPQGLILCREMWEEHWQKKLYCLSLWRKIAITLALIQQLSLNGNTAGNLLLTCKNIRSEMEKRSLLFVFFFHDVIHCANDRLCAKLVSYALENNLLHCMLVLSIATWYSLCN